MQSNEPDSYSDESEEDYIARKKEESNAATGLMFALLALFLFCLKIAIIYGLYFYAGFLLSEKILGTETEKTKIWVFTIFFTYLIFCIIYFLKGTVIGLRARNRKLWILPWVICVLICCIIPAYIAKAFVNVMLLSSLHHDNIWYIIISWGTFIISASYIYNIYEFETHSAPRFLYWSYVLGIKLTS